MLEGKINRNIQQTRTYAEPRAMHLAEFIEETISVLGTDAQELVERAKPLRNNPGPNEGALVSRR